MASKTVGPKVVPVKNPVSKPSRRPGCPPLHEHLPQIDGPGGGALVLLISPVKTGKSSLITNMLLNENFYNAQERFDSTTIISNTISNCVTSRFLKQAFDTVDHYSDETINGIVERQKSYDKEDQQEICICIDDCLGSIRKEAKINHLCSRFRHFNIKLLIISSQNFRSCSPIIRQNATNVIVGSPFPNMKEKLKMAEEYGDVFGGAENWLKIYELATPNRYDFLHMDFQSNPPKAYHNMEKLIALGHNIIGDSGKVSDKGQINRDEPSEK